VKLDAIEGPTFDLVEKTIYADAHTAALNPAEATTGRLIPMVERDSAGRQITRFAGDIKAFMAPFMAPGQTVAIRRPQGRV
ncbi:MAG: NUDIX hydrolase, partial [Ferrovum sp.]|nr:NUDIX hydrolase [Ferrovum sp.]